MEGKWEVFVKELKMVSFLSAPMVAVLVLQYCLPFVSLMMVGHLDELSLSGVSVASSYVIVTGYSLISESWSFGGTYFAFWSLSNPELETSMLLLCHSKVCS
nr:protein detoxification 1 [Quercus suber]